MVSTATGTETAAPTAAPRHPLDPLSAAEVAAATDLLRQAKGLAASARFVFVSLHEPAKESVLAYRAGDPMDREAEIVIRELAERATYEAVVSVTAQEVRRWRAVEGIQPSLMFEELLASERLVRADPQWQAAMRARGLDRFDLSLIDPWPLGYLEPSDAPHTQRTLRMLTWIRTHATDNGYARPVEGLIVTVDLDALTIVRVEDHGIVPLPPGSGNYTVEGITDPSNVPSFPEGVRRDLKPLEIVQPEGPSFTVDGYEVRWQKWHLRVGFTPREGLVLHTIGYEDRGRLRPIIYRASLSELFVPYGDPSPAHYRKNAFDVGEVGGIGTVANSLTLGCDCLGEIRYLDATIHDGDGDPVTIPNAICMHEEDNGILWKHFDYRIDATEVRRSRRFVISSISTIGNYEYGFFWYFYQDGSIEHEVKLTGVITNSAVHPGEAPAYGTIVAPGVYGPNHQHFFNVRLDMMVDGLDNAVYERQAEAQPLGPANPYGSTWTTRTTLLASESTAQRLIDPLVGRDWIITNPNVRNPLGEPVAYELVPGHNVLPLFHPEAPTLKRGAFATRHLWVTRYSPTERYAAGDYPNQHPGGDGLPAYVQADRALDNTDLVVWYTFGAHHVVRPEDWPVMPVTRLGFLLRPSGFFDGNPGLDVPPSPAHGRDCHV